MCLPRGRAFIVSAIATLKAGGVYVPLDPTLPEARLRLLAEAAAPAATIVARVPVASRRALPGRTIAFDTLAASPCAHTSPPRVYAEDACILYTSGTTGKPKGVVIPRQGITRLVTPQHYLAVTSDDRILHHSNLSFDASTFEIWAPLLNGATLVVHTADTFDLAAFARAVRDERITVLLVTTGLFHLIADLMPACFRGVRVVLTGGESLYAGPVRRVLAACPSTSVVNGYGPTENTVYTTCHLIEPGAVVTDPIPIGRPIAGTEIRIVADDASSDTRIGHLLVSGTGLSRGYFGQDALNAHAFEIDDTQRPPKRFYRTGDLVRTDDDGHLYFVGRIDNQVKLRGFRIEPEEIESRINAVAGVTGSVVTLHGTHASNRHLVAHVKLAPESGATAVSVRNALERALPTYMVPSAIVAVDTLPLTPNGKVDRARLAASYTGPEASVDDAATDATATDAPARLGCVLDSWRKHLDAPGLEWHDNVFDRGASSLTAVSVQIDIDRTLDCSVPMTALVAARTPLDWADVYASRLLDRFQPST
ncbi:non-ribosomal peptide synthetase [Burkholderia sp. MSMB1826]|uniref:non-ribosomal peptide synthetase n=1 Tax=Burkholderia sp. MSMB1826 TaxID=1637875 RepID=UPI0009E6AF14|nr:non-ribosomal peptide synthetase [Burkholderia sp. MSMB1826]